MMLPALVADLQQHPRRLGLRIIGFALEEADLRGSRVYVRSLGQGELGRIRAMINLDTLGLRRMRIDPRSTRELRELLQRLAADLPGGPLRTDRIRWLSGDFEPFAARGVPVLNLHALRHQDQGLVHSHRDRPGVVDPGYYRESYLLVRRLTEALINPPPTSPVR